MKRSALPLVLGVHGRVHHSPWQRRVRIHRKAGWAAAASGFFAIQTSRVAHRRFEKKMVWNASFLSGLWFMAVVGITSVGLSAVLPTGELMAPRGAANLTSFNLPVDPASLTAQLGPVGDAAMAILNGEATRQAAFIADLDNFHMLFWVLLPIIALAWVARRPPPGQDKMHIAE